MEKDLKRRFQEFCVSKKKSMSYMVELLAKELLDKKATR